MSWFLSEAIYGVEDASPGGSCWSWTRLAEWSVALAR